MVMEITELKKITYYLQAAAHLICPKQVETAITKVHKLFTVKCISSSSSWALQVSCKLTTDKQWLSNWRSKISPVGDWRSTSLEWRPWPWIRPYGIPSCITHRPLPTYQNSLRSEENFFRSPLRFWSSSESRDKKTRTNIKNPERSNLDIVL